MLSDQDRGLRQLGDLVTTDETPHWPADERLPTLLATLRHVFDYLVNQLDRHAPATRPKMTRLGASLTR